MNLDGDIWSGLAPRAWLDFLGFDSNERPEVFLLRHSSWIDLCGLGHGLLLLRNLNKVFDGRELLVADATLLTLYIVVDKK